MGLFDKLFDKKTCSICGGEIGLLGNRKLADGNLCKECASKLSPLFSDRRESTVEQIREQLEYRAANESRVAAFNVTRTFGTATKVLVDDEMGAFVVVSSDRWRSNNPDVINLYQVTGCDVDVKETKTEIRKKNEDGTTESYNPPRWDVDYDVYVVVYVSAPFFDQVRFKVNGERIEQRPSRAFVEATNCAGEIKAFMTGTEFVPEEVPEDRPPMPRPMGGAPMGAHAPAAGAARPPMPGQAGAGRPMPGAPAQGAPRPAQGRPVPPQQGASPRAAAAARTATAAPKFCPHCGQPVANPAAPFCANCGKKLNS